MSSKEQVKDKVDPRVIPFLLILIILEFKLAILGKSFILVAGRDSWLAAILGGILVSLGTYFLLCLMNRFPNQNYFQYLPQVWGKPIAFIIFIGYFLFWASHLILLFKNTGEVNQVFFLEKTPVLLPVFLVAIAAVWIIAYGFVPLVRFIQIINPIFLIPFLIAIPLALSSVEIDHLFPIFANGIMPILKGAIIYTGYFQGLEVLLFLSPFLKDTTKASKPALAGIFFLNFIAFAFTILSIGILGIDNTNQQMWPGFSMLSLIEIPGLPAERFELLLSFPLLITIFVAISTTLYLLSYGIMQVFKISISHRKAIIYSMAFLTVIATLFIPNFAWCGKLRHTHVFGAIVFIYLVPSLTLLLAVVRKRGIVHEK